MTTLLKALFGRHVHAFGPWFEEAEARPIKLVSPLGTTSHTAWYQKRVCVDTACQFAEIRKLGEGRQ